MRGLKSAMTLCIWAAAWGCVPGELDDGAPVAEPDFTPKAAGDPGSACRCDSDCSAIEGHQGICVFGVCMTRASASCSFGGSSAECPDGSRCWSLTGYEGPICWPDYDAYPRCVGARDSDGSCFFTDETSSFCDSACASYCEGSSSPASSGAGGGIGAACADDGDCGGATCYRDAAGTWADGYCMDFYCSEPSAPCGDDGICVPRLATNGANICMQPCGSSGCRQGYACRTVNGHDICWPSEPCSPSNPDGSCPGEQTCVEGTCRLECSPSRPDGWCPEGLECIDGACGASAGCGSWECTGDRCDDIIAVPGSSDPRSAEARSAGYYLAHGREYSYLRGDLVSLIQWSACQMRSRFPGMAPLALLDLTTADGETPGCPDGCRHPSGTHTGSDIDTAYFQTDGDNNGQCICGDGSARCWNGYADEFSDGYRCSTEENIMDLEQQIWFLIYMSHHPGWRVVGVDDTVCDDIRERADELLARGDIDEATHGRITSLGCYSSHSSWAYHHHHLHFSFY